MALHSPALPVRGRQSIARPRALHTRRRTLQDRRLATMPAPLVDRMQRLELPGLTALPKVALRAAVLVVVAQVVVPAATSP